MNELQTSRLRLRRWREDDLVPFAAINADARVMEYFPGTLDRMASEALVVRIEAHFDTHGFGFWALERRDDGRLLGFVGLAVPAFEAPFTPCVEIGWRLAAHCWGQGYATEGARAALEAGFESFGLAQIVSFTVVDNSRSRRVMERLGMSRSPEDDFLHPALAPEHPLAAHVLYRLTKSQWQVGIAARSPGSRLPPTSR